MPITKIIVEKILYILVSIFPLYRHFDLLLGYEQFVIGLNSDLVPVDTRFLHLVMMSFLLIIFFMSFLQIIYSLLALLSRK